MRSGALRHKLIIQKPATMVARGTGGEDLGTPWETHAEVYGALEPLRGRERQAAQKILDATSVKFRIRYEAGVLPEMRIIYRQKPFYINSVVDLDRRKIELLIHALVQEQGAYLPTINISNVGATGGDAFYVVISFDTDQEGSTKIQYKEDGGSWLYTDDADISPRVFSHSETIGPLDGEKNYLADVWTQDHFAQTDGYEGSLTWGIDTDGSYLADGYAAAPVLESGPTTTPAQTTCLVEWTTDVEAYHRVRYRKSGEWTTTAWSGSPSTSAAVTLTPLDSEYYQYYYDIQSCLVGDGSAAFDWYPGDDSNSFYTTCTLSIVYSNFYAQKRQVGKIDVLRLSWDTATECKADNARWKLLPDGSWNEKWNYRGRQTSHFVDYTDFKFDDGSYAWLCRNMTMCNEQGAGSALQYFSVIDSDIVIE